MSEIRNPGKSHKTKKSEEEQRVVAARTNNHQRQERRWHDYYDVAKDIEYRVYM